MKTSGKLLVAILALVLGALALTGCGSLGQNKGLLLANIGWDENVAVSNLTKGSPIYLQGRVHLPRLVAALDESEVQNQVSGGPQGRHGPDERPG